MVENHKRKPTFIENPLQVVEHCRYSLMCRHVCPVGHVTHNETLTPHGWALMIASVQRGLLEWNSETVDALYKCADCGLCRTHCATDQPLPTGIVSARAQVVEAGLAPAPVLDLKKKLEKWKNPFEETMPEDLAGAGDDALLVGDAAFFRGRAELEAAVQLLNATGLQPVQLAGGRNLGLLPSSVGLKQIAAELASETVEEIKGSGCRRLFLLTPGDFYTVARLYPERLNLSLPEEVEVIDLSVYLAESRDSGKLRLAGQSDSEPYAYHDPEHGARIGRHHSAPRQLLRNVFQHGLEVSLFWREDRSHPTGAVGGLNWVQPALARDLTESRLSAAITAGARRLFTEDPISLDALQKQAEDRIEVAGLYQTIAAHLS